MKLFKEDGTKAGLFDVCRWWIHTYPADVFENSPEYIVEIRRIMEKFLKEVKNFSR